MDPDLKTRARILRRTVLVPDNGPSPKKTGMNNPCLCPTLAREQVWLEPIIIAAEDRILMTSFSTSICHGKE